MTSTYLKRREAAQPGSIPARLQMFEREIRFYREVAPHVGIRVPGCLRAEVHDDGSTLLELEDLSEWRAGAEPEAGAALLSMLHARWRDEAWTRWPWLPRNGVEDLVENLYDRHWPAIEARRDLTPAARAFGERLVGHVAQAERTAAGAGSVTLTHGDPSGDNLRTSSSGEVALLDWEDVGAGPGVADLAWFLVSTAELEDWPRAIATYGDATGLRLVLPAAAVQGFLSVASEEEGSQDARAWVACLEEAARRS